MPRIISAGITLAMAVLLSSTPLHAQAPAPAEPGEMTEIQEVALLEKQSEEAYADERWVKFYVANMKLHELRAYESEYLVNIIRACALLDRKSTAYHYMLQMQQQGMAFDFDSIEDSRQIRDTEAYDYINGLLTDAANKAGEGTLSFTAPGNPADYRSLAWDASRDRFLVGTVQDGAIVSLSVDGEREVLLDPDAKNGIWSVDGLAVDPESQRLWVSSGATDQYAGPTPADNNLGAVFELDLESMEVLGRYNLPEDGLKHQPGGIALTDDGHVYVLNQAAPVVYRRAPGSENLELFFGAPTFTGFQDIAVAPDNSRVYVVDAHKGILVMEPASEQAALISGPETMNLGGIGGIEYRDGALYLVQGGFEPQRVIRLELDDTGAVIESISPMAIALDVFERPAISTIRENDLVYFANTGAENAREIIAMATPLDAGAEVAPPGMAEFEKALRAKQQQDNN